MAITRHEQLYYNNIERIATALEKLVAQGKDNKLDTLDHSETSTVHCFTI